MKPVADDFSLHPRLAADTCVVGDLPVSRLLLMNDRRFAWCVLVPRAPGLRELHEIPEAARLPLFEEVERVSRLLLARTGAHKINVAALGNLVEQLHVHVVARQPGDAAWPGPVWGVGAAEPYRADALEREAAAWRDALNLSRIDSEPR